jgi:hypothetical protein
LDKGIGNTQSLKKNGQHRNSIHFADSRGTSSTIFSPAPGWGQRLTIDIDFVGDDVSPSEMDQILMQAAKEMKLYVEPVPIERFIPIPAGSDERTIRIGQFGNMEVFVADPYVIALSKLDSAFDTDFDDLIFLIRRDLIELDQLEQITRNALSRAREFDMNPDDLLAHLQELKHRLK